MNPFSFSVSEPRSRANERGRALAAVGRAQEAIAEYERACRLDSTWSMPAFNLGLYYKYSGDWKRSLEYNQRATELDPEDQGGWWNLGIAATALGRWDVARSAWHGAGLQMPDGDGPPNLPVRSDADPAEPRRRRRGRLVGSSRSGRARIVSIPLAESGFALPIWSSAMAPRRAAGGWVKLPSVFDCLQLLEASSFSTWVAEVEPSVAPATPDLSWSDLLEDLAVERGLAAEDWTRSIARICKACSEGRPHAAHAREHSDAGPHRVAIAAHDSEEVHSLLDEWRRRTEAARVLTVDVVSPWRAGQEMSVVYRGRRRIPARGRSDGRWCPRFVALLFSGLSSAVELKRTGGNSLGNSIRAWLKRS